MWLLASPPPQQSLAHLAPLGVRCLHALVLDLLILLPPSVIREGEVERRAAPLASSSANLHQVPRRCPPSRQVRPASTATHQHIGMHAHTASCGSWHTSWANWGPGGWTHRATHGRASPTHLAAAVAHLQVAVRCPLIAKAVPVAARGGRIARRTARRARPSCWGCPPRHRGHDGLSSSAAPELADDHHAEQHGTSQGSSTAHSSVSACSTRLAHLSLHGPRFREAPLLVARRQDARGTEGSSRVITTQNYMVQVKKVAQLTAAPQHATRDSRIYLSISAWPTAS